MKWLWKFVDGAKSAGELYGRTLVVFAAQHYAHQIALPTSQRRPSALPASRKDAARKAFEKLTKPVLPASHAQLARAIEREARDYYGRQVELEQNAYRDANPPADPAEVEVEHLDETSSEDLVTATSSTRSRRPRRSQGEGPGHGRPHPRPPTQGHKPGGRDPKRQRGVVLGHRRRLPTRPAIRHASAAAARPPSVGPTSRELARALSGPGGRTPGMRNHHPHPTPSRPTAKQHRYLRQLAEQTGTTFTPPKTKAEASREIERLQGRGPDARGDRVRDRRAVQHDLQTGVGDAVRHRASDTTGYGSSARWNRGGQEPGR